MSEAVYSTGVRCALIDKLSFTHDFLDGDLNKSMAVVKTPYIIRWTSNMQNHLRMFVADRS